MISDVATELHNKLILDGTKIAWHQDRIAAWQRGERFAPITIDMALTRACQYACGFCYSKIQENERKAFTRETIINFIDDAAEVGVKGISLVSDGESTMSPHFEEMIELGGAKGISMAVGSNGYALDERRIRKILPHLTYFRFNVSAGEPKRYADIMGVKEGAYYKVMQNARDMVRIKKELGLKCTIGFQMVFDPRYHDQVLPFVKLGKEIGVDYSVVKHCSDDSGFLGVDYSKYKDTYETLRQAEAMSTDTYQATVKWAKIETAGVRSYERCHGSAFLLQISGSGLVAPCGQMFNEKYKKYHAGNIVTERFKDIVFSDRYWAIQEYLASEDFNAKRMCGSLCLQDLPNRYLDKVKRGEIITQTPEGVAPQHYNYI